ncbi:MAG: hypothetical protein ACLVKK_08905 [Ruthenibacterium sp.]
MEYLSGTKAPRWRIKVRPEQQHRPPPLQPYAPKEGWPFFAYESLLTFLPLSKQTPPHIPLTQRYARGRWFMNEKWQISKLLKYKKACLFLKGRPFPFCFFFAQAL